MPDMDDLYVYVAGDYMATGEGRTIMLMVTRAYPHRDDYAVAPKYAPNDKGVWEYTPGVLKGTRNDIALREFGERFGDWFGQCGRVIPKDEFFTQYDTLLPPFVRKMVDGPDHPGNFKWVTECHYNYS